jgi:hypothetical protein
MIFPLDFSSCVFDWIEGDTLRTLSDQFTCHRDGKMRRVSKSHKDRFCDFHFELIREWRSAREGGRMNLAEALAQFSRWWKSNGKRFPGLAPENVVARIVARADSISYPSAYFAEVCHNMWQAQQPGRTAPPGDYSGPEDEVV